MKIGFPLTASFIFGFTVIVLNVKAQTTPNYSLVDNLNPVTPTMRQFTKYTDLPVSEYTGIPNISIPVYEIDEDGVKIPLDLTYHAGGIKINEEASWVGLGWDMTIGSIVQQINDQDDFESGVTHLQSDFLNTGTPLMYPQKYQYCTAAIPQCISPCSSTVPVTSATTAFGMVVYTGQYAPFNGVYNQQDYLHYFDDHVSYKVDSEPDVFTANFCGHSFKFIIQWSSTNYPTVVVLDKKGYQVSRTANIWTVVTPGGETYIFNELDPIQNISSSVGITGASFTSLELPSSNVWLLTQIITKNKKTITFNYTQTATEAVYPQFSQHGFTNSAPVTFSGSIEDIQAFCRPANVGASAISGGPLNTVNYSFEPYTYLSSVIFPNGSINFNLSARNDVNGALKLDSLSVSSSQVVKSWKFNYSYFDATGVGGNTFTAFNATGFANYPLYRLKLQSVQDNSGATYNFTYNNTSLPVKNSFATDLWGYYNGDLNNTSFIPDATQFKQTGYFTNGDNHSANLTYTQAGILQQIQYPTGGSVNFTYGLNQFSNYWVPDYAANTNTITSGDGLRVQSIVWKDASGNQLKQTNYTYSGGIASIPLNIFRPYVYGTVAAGGISGGGAGPNWRSYNIYETNPSGCFTANPFASFNGVGYSQVTMTAVDNNGNPNGKTLSNYYNNPDLVYNSLSIIAQIDPTLPAFKNPQDTAENGSLKSQLIYDSSNNLLKKTVNTYVKSTSSIYYGARVMGYADYVNYSCPDDSYPCEQLLYAQNAVSYYPIFDFESLLSSSTATDYFGTDSVAVTTTNTYDTYNQMASTIKTNSTYNQTTTFNYPYNSGSSSVLTAMVTQNRLADVISMTQGTANSSYSFTRTYSQLGNLIVPGNDNIINHGTSGIGIPTIINYDQIDPLNGNILQYTKNSLTNSFLYDYNKEYVIAEVKNAPYTLVAYTSFEADGTGRWKFTGPILPDNTAPTGKKDYSLSNGNIYRDSLSTTQTYVVSYWSKSGSQIVNGNNSPIQGYTYNGWTYYEHTIPNPTGGTITVSGTGTIDELRLYPSNAQMTTYAYEPLVGITSTSDAGAKISYYEYDGSKRLLDIRDQSKNILKAFCYNYAGQPTNCGVNVLYSSAAKSGTYTAACPAGSTGSSVTYNVLAGKYASTMSQADADNQAQADVTVNGQNYANANGTCTVTSVQVTFEVQTSHASATNFDIVANGQNISGPRTTTTQNQQLAVVGWTPINSNSTVVFQVTGGYQPVSATISGFWGNINGVISGTNITFTGPNLSTAQSVNLNVN